MTAPTPTSALLTGPDLRAFETLAESKVGNGIWARVERRQDDRFDLFSIHYPGRPGPVISVGRRRGGRYVVLNHALGSMRFGRSFAEALQHLQP